MPPESVSFDRAVEYYDETRGFPPGEEIPVAALIRQAGAMGHDSRVLEIGIGTGRIALPVAKGVSAYYGIDISRGMMNRLRAKQNGEPVYLTEGDATRLPFRTASFNGAVAVHVFHLIPGWRAVLAEVARVLKPGARLVNCWTSPDRGMEDLWEAWRDAVPSAEIDVGINWRTNRTFLEDGGWQPVTEELTHPYSRPITPSSLVANLERRIWSRTWRITDEENARGVAAVKARIAEAYPDPDAPIPVTSEFVARAYVPPKR